MRRTKSIIIFNLPDRQNFYFRVNGDDDDDDDGLHRLEVGPEIKSGSRVTTAACFLF